MNLQRFHVPEHLTLQELRAQRRNTMARLGPAILKPQKWWLVLSGIVSIVFGGFLVVSPAVGALALVWWIGAYAVVFGVLLLGLAFRLRRVRAELPDVPYARAA